MPRASLAVLAAFLLVVLVPGRASANVPGTTCPVFPADNVWNADISSLPVHARSAAWLSSTGANSGRLLHPDFGVPPYGLPFNVVNSSHATANFSFLYAAESDPNPYPAGNDLLIEQGSDAHLLTINQDTCRLYEIGGTNMANHTGWAGAIFDLNSDALRPAGWTSADAAGLPIFPGLVRVDEVQAGAINHAIRFTVQQSDTSYLWPARHQAGSASDPNLPPMGARFRLKATFPISGYSAPTQVVLTAFKHYGLIVADNGSNWFFQGTEDPAWSAYSQMDSELKKVPANQFEAVDESSLMVDPNSGGTATVPGAPSSVTAVAGDRAAQVSWTAAASGGSPITGYTITGSPGGSATAAAGETQATVWGLANGTSYTFTVRAANRVGTGPGGVSNPVT
ncbi:MAG TPA: fibronectin type III domain-containing protein, partial [Candidatus Acidoferrales bacterium]|nr:fibronectin type III domain-containing protein [Candidatus Acidoferrales bacterium]